MLIVLSIVSILFLIQFLIVKKNFEIDPTRTMGVLYYSSMFFLSIIGGLWFLVLLANLIFWIYALFMG